MKPVLSLQSEPSREGSGGSLFLPFFVLESGPLPRPPPETIFTDFDLILASQMGPEILKTILKNVSEGPGVFTGASWPQKVVYGRVRGL